MTRSLLRRTIAQLAAIVLIVLGSSVLLSTAGGAQTSTEPVPCDVAMVVGCVATVEGPNGEVTTTLRVDEPGADQTTSTGDGGSPASPVAAASNEGITAGTGTDTGTGTEGEGESTAGDTTAGEGATGQSTEGGLLTPPDSSDRPLSDLDPWERGGLKSNFGSRSIPISHYQIGADVSGWLGVPDPLDSFVASQTNWAFTTATFLVLLATNSLDWAFEFPLAEDLVGDAGVLAQSYSVDFFGFGLSTSIYSLALSVTMVVAGFKAVTKGMIAAGSEVLMAFVAYVVLIVMTLTSGFGTAGLTVARVSSDLSSEIASFASGQERQAECAAQLQPSTTSGQDVPLAGAEASTEAIAAAGSSACSFGFAIQRSLVELPYQNLQWGQVLDGVSGKERCAAINMELLAEGPWGNDDEPRNRMKSAPECEENANFNHQATYIRLGIASANTMAAAAVTLLVLVVSAMLLWQQLKLLFLTVVMPHALVFAILPGRSRRLAWMWIEHLVGVVIRTVILALGLVVWLSLFSLIVHEQLTARGIFLSLFASLAMAVSGFYGLYRLSGITRKINPVAGRGRSAGGSDPTPESTTGGRSAVRTVAGARSTLRSITTKTGSTAKSRSTISGGPGDLPGVGAAATPTKLGSVSGSSGQAGPSSGPGSGSRSGSDRSPSVSGPTDKAPVAPMASERS